MLVIPYILLSCKPNPNSSTQNNSENSAPGFGIEFETAPEKPISTIKGQIRVSFSEKPKPKYYESYLKKKLKEKVFDSEDEALEKINRLLGQSLKVMHKEGDLESEINEVQNILPMEDAVIIVSLQIKFERYIPPKPKKKPKKKAKKPKVRQVDPTQKLFESEFESDDEIPEEDNNMDYETEEAQDDSIPESDDSKNTPPNEPEKTSQKEESDIEMEEQDEDQDSDEYDLE